jgi:hypothetical protein
VPDEELVYARGQLSIAELNREVESFWGELGVSDDLKAKLAAHEVDANELLRLPPAEAVIITSDSAGIDPGSIALIIAFAPSVNHALKSAWDTVILPWIRHRRGEDAIKDRHSKDGNA